MKKNKILLAVLLAAVMCLAVFAACETDTTYTLSKTSHSMEVGETLQLTITTVPERDIEVTYASSNASVATVSPAGLITAVAAGTTNITATVDGQTLTCAVTVTAPAQTYEYSLSHTTLTLEIGATQQLTLTSEPTQDLTGKVTFASSDISVASVNATGLVRANAEGTATITATIDSRNFSCVVTVPPAYTYQLSATTLTMTYGDTARKLTVSSTPAGATINPTFATSNSAVATVDSEGNVLPVAPGTANITASIDGTTLTCAVTVNYRYGINKTSTTVKLGTTDTVSPVISPTKSDAVVSYTSQYPAVATVNGEGVIAPVSVGTTDITVTIDGNDFVCTVTVAPAFVTATATSTEITGGEINLSAADVIYWEYYGWYNNTVNEFNKKFDGEDLILTNTIYTVMDRNFYDYKASVSFTNGETPRAVSGKKDGRQLDSDIVMTVKLVQGINTIRIYTGAYNATNTTSIAIDGYTLATAQPFTSSGSSINMMVEFTIDMSAPATATITLAPSDINEGNVSIVAATIVGAARTPAPATTSIAYSQTQLLGESESTFNLSTKGSKDWYYLNYENEGGVQKNEANYIQTNMLRISNSDKFWDYKASFTWEDGQEFATPASPKDPHCATNYTNDGLCGSAALVYVDVDSTVQHIYIYASGYQATYSVQVVDKNGNLLVNQQIAERIEGTSIAYEVDLAITATEADTLKILVFITDGTNCGVAAVAVA